MEDAFSQEVVAEEAGHKEVLPVQLLEGDWGRRGLLVTVQTTPHWVHSPSNLMLKIQGTPLDWQM